VRELAVALSRFAGIHSSCREQLSDVESLCENALGNIHLLLTDMVLPRVSGREMPKRASVLRPESKFYTCRATRMMH